MNGSYITCTGTNTVSWTEKNTALQSACRTEENMDCDVCLKSVLMLPFFPSQQTGEYATDEEETATTVAGGDKSIEVFDLPETEDILSPSELDANKLYQKFREVNATHHCVKITQLARDHHIFLWQRFQE